MDSQKLLHELIEKMSADASNPKRQKAAAIAENVLYTTGAVIKSARVAYPPKRILRKKDRRPIKGIRRTQAKIGMLLSARFGAAKVAAILSQPIPNYINGAYDHPGGAVIVGSPGIESTKNPGITPGLSHQSKQSTTK